MLSKHWYNINILLFFLFTAGNATKRKANEHVHSGPGHPAETQQLQQSRQQSLGNAAGTETSDDPASSSELKLPVNTKKHGSGMKKRSDVWDHFNENDVNNDVQCKDCETILHRKGDASTGAMRNHLRSKGHKRTKAQKEQENSQPSTAAITTPYSEGNEFVSQQQIVSHQQSAVAEISYERTSSSSDEPELEENNDPKKDGSEMKKRSKMWDHFRAIKESKDVSCKHCESILKRNVDASTGSMKNHLKSVHGMFKEEVVKKRKKQHLQRHQQREVENIGTETSNEQASSSSDEPELTNSINSMKNHLVKVKQGLSKGKLVKKRKKQISQQATIAMTPADIEVNELVQVQQNPQQQMQQLQQQDIGSADGAGTSVNDDPATSSYGQPGFTSISHPAQHLNKPNSERIHQQIAYHHDHIASSSVASFDPSLDIVRAISPVEFLPVPAVPLAQPFAAPFVQQHPPQQQNPTTAEEQRKLAETQRSLNKLNAEICQLKRLLEQEKGKKHFLEEQSHFLARKQAQMKERITVLESELVRHGHEIPVCTQPMLLQEQGSQSLSTRLEFTDLTIRLSLIPMYGEKVIQWHDFLMNLDTYTEFGGDDDDSLTCFLLFKAEPFFNADSTPTQLRKNIDIIWRSYQKEENSARAFHYLKTMVDQIEGDLAKAREELLKRDDLCLSLQKVLHFLDFSNFGNVLVLNGSEFVGQFWNLLLYMHLYKSLLMLNGQFKPDQTTEPRLKLMHQNGMKFLKQALKQIGEAAAAIIEHPAQAAQFLENQRANCERAHSEMFGDVNLIEINQEKELEAGEK